jgi:hypothetical protein
LRPNEADLSYLRPSIAIKTCGQHVASYCNALSNTSIHWDEFMFSFWPLLIALIAAYGSMYLVDWFSLTPSSNSWTLTWITVLAGGLYLIAGGVEMATRWGDTISTTNIAQIPDYAHTPKAMLAGLLLVFWPYTVMVAGALPALAALRCLLRKTSRTS